jgi:hypothetical protein
MVSMGFVDDFTDGLQGLVGPGRKFKNPNQLSEHLGQPATQTSRYLKGERTTYLTAIGDMLDKLGFKLLAPGAVPAKPAEKARFDEEELRRKIANDVARICIEASVDTMTVARLLAVTRGEYDVGEVNACAWPAVGRKTG